MKWASDSLEKLETTREERLHQKPPTLGEGDADKLLHEFHPDYLGMKRNVRVGPNAGSDEFPHELADLLESDSHLSLDFEPSVNIETDVLILGGCK